MKIAFFQCQTGVFLGPGVPDPSIHSGDTCGGGPTWGHLGPNFFSALRTEKKDKNPTFLGDFTRPDSHPPPKGAEPPCSPNCQKTHLLLLHQHLQLLDAKGKFLSPSGVGIEHLWQVGAGSRHPRLALYLPPPAQPCSGRGRFLPGLKPATLRRCPAVVQGERLGDGEGPAGLEAAADHLPGGTAVQEGLAGGAGSTPPHPP